jgi:hypothetical protein
MSCSNFRSKITCSSHLCAIASERMVVVHLSVVQSSGALVGLEITEMITGLSVIDSKKRQSRESHADREEIPSTHRRSAFSQVLECQTPMTHERVALKRRSILANSIYMRESKWHSCLLNRKDIARRSNTMKSIEVFKFQGDRCAVSGHSAGNPRGARDGTVSGSVV